jgi:WhiB family redox-sensing transcriptional regulator
MSAMPTNHLQALIGGYVDNEPNYAWRYQAKCAGDDTEVFYPPRDRRMYKGIADQAKAICWGTGDNDTGCPVRNECLWYAIELDDTHGIWGGLSNRERSHLRRKFEKDNPTGSLKDYILEWDGGNKAKRHAKDLLGYEED